MESQALTLAQTVTLAAQSQAWLRWAAQEDSGFIPSNHEINVYQRPSGVVDFFVRCTVENPYSSEPSFHLGYIYPNGSFIETYTGEEVSCTYWENVCPV